MRLIDSREFCYWTALYRIDPWGDDWWQAARICAAAKTAMGGGARPVDFWPGEMPQQSPGEILTVMMQASKQQEAAEQKILRRHG